MVLTETQLKPAPPDNPFATSPWSGRRLLLMSAAIILGVVIGATILVALLMPESLTGATPKPTTPYMVAMLGMQAAVMFACIYLIGVGGQAIGWRDFGIQSTSWGWVWKALGLTVLLRIVVAGMAVVMMQIGIVSQQPQAIAPDGFSWFGATGMIVLAGIVVPIAEELFFRGMLYRWMRSRWSVWLASVVSSLLFAIVHIELATALPVFVLGMVLALVYEHSRSLWTSILIHCVNNLIAIGLLYALLAAGVPIPGVNG